MIPPEAIQRFAHRQKKLLVATYDGAWAQGVAQYQPPERPSSEPTPAQLAAAGVGTAALWAATHPRSRQAAQPRYPYATAPAAGPQGRALGARRLYPYVAPAVPDPVRRAQALAPAFRGVNGMVGELGAWAATNVAQAAADFHQAILDWVDSNAYRLDGGASTAWAGQQNGYGEAADSAGELLEWHDEDDDRTCEDCVALAAFPPMPLGEWPSQPGDGSTACSIGCRCELVVSEVQVVPGDDYTPPLSDGQQQLVGALTDRQAEALGSLMPDAQYLD